MYVLNLMEFLDWPKTIPMPILKLSKEIQWKGKPEDSHSLPHRPETLRVQLSQLRGRFPDLRSSKWS